MPCASAKTIYISAAANRHENGVTCQYDTLLYSRDKSPVIYDLKTKTTFISKPFHSKEVNGLCFVVNKRNCDAQRIISTSYDGRAIISSIDRDSQTITFNKLFELDCKDGSVDPVLTTRCCIQTEENSFLSIITTLDGGITLWKNEDCVAKLRVDYSGLTSRIVQRKSRVENYDIILFFLGASDNKIHIFQVHNNSINHLLDLTGHSDWIKCIDINEYHSHVNGLFLASASQDTYIRVWEIKIVDEALIYKRQVRRVISKELCFDPPKSRYMYLTATLETVISGHEGIVYGLRWIQNPYQLGYKLISCSADKNIIIWTASSANLNTNNGKESGNYQQDAVSSDKFTVELRVGETGETNLPFIGVCPSEDGTTFYAQSLHGAIHSWSKQPESDSWQSQQFIIGHFGQVTDLCWQRQGHYLLTCSTDKTCRMHAIAKSDDAWHEIARPLVHGHEINCISSMGFDSFAIGAEEKTIRTFHATQFFIKNYEALTKSGLPQDLGDKSLADYPQHAQLPALGLSIRGSTNVYDSGDTNAKDSNSTSNAWYARSDLIEKLSKMNCLESLPVEEILLQSTLWWESNKLYGHGNEIYTLTFDSEFSFMASASKANKSDLASIIVWETSKFRKVATIEHHTLTITRLRFSPDNKYLLSVSRDRTWSLSLRTGQLRQAYKKFLGSTKSNGKHERIIWDCCWTHDSKYFMTVSREGRAILWSIVELEKLQSHEDITKAVVIEISANEQNFQSIQSIDSPDSDILGQGKYLFALGNEVGTCYILQIEVPDPSQNESVSSYEIFLCLEHHHLSGIRRLCFKPTASSNGPLSLASAADDGIVKLIEVEVNH